MKPRHLSPRSWCPEWVGYGLRRSCFANGAGSDRISLQHYAGGLILAFQSIRTGCCGKPPRAKHEG